MMDTLVNFLATMPFWYWWVLAAALLIAEITTGTTYALWPAAAAALLGVICLFGLDGQWQLQLFLFASLTFAFTIFGTPYAKKWLQSSRRDHELLNQRGAQKIGKTAIVDADFISNRGKVKLGDTLWLAESEDDTALKAGAEVEITSVSGTTLFVKLR